jgi:hypothetical protein
MQDEAKIKLYSSYRTPRFRIGANVRCKVRGDLTIMGVSDARIRELTRL